MPTMISPDEWQAATEQCLVAPRNHQRGWIGALVLVLCGLLLLAGCSGRPNDNIELIKRVEDAELGCYISPKAMVQRESLAYTASATDLVILDVSDPVNPRCLSTFDTKRIVNDVALAGSYAFLAAEGLIVMDISDPRNPVELFRYASDSMATDIKLKDGHLYLAAVQNGLLVFDVSNPERPQIISEMTFPDAAVERSSVNVTAIDFVDGYAYVLVEGDYPYFIAILDVADPASPRVIRRYVPESEHNPFDMVVYGQFAYLNGGLLDIDVVDVSDPLLPQLVGSINTPGQPGKYVGDGNYIYVGDSFNISVIEISNPAKPRVVGFYDISSSSDIAKIGDYLYTVGQTRENGEAQPPKLHIFRFTP